MARLAAIEGHSPLRWALAQAWWLRGCWRRVQTPAAAAGRPASRSFLRPRPLVAAGPASGGPGPASLRLTGVRGLR